MIDLKALRLAAIVMAHGNPSCMVFLLPNGANMLEGSCWATVTNCGSSRREVRTQLLTERINPTVTSVRNWLGY